MSSPILAQAPLPSQAFSPQTRQEPPGILPKSVTLFLKLLSRRFWLFNCRPAQPRIWVWPHTPSGQYSTKSGYRALYDQNKLSSSDPGRQPHLNNGVNLWKIQWHLDLPETSKFSFGSVQEVSYQSNSISHLAYIRFPRPAPYVSWRTKAWNIYSFAVW